MRILFITSSRVGDAVLSTGLLDHLIRRYPGARFTIACGRPAAEVFDRMPGRERTLIIDKQRWDLHWPALWLQAVARRWDLVVDLRGSALAFLVRSRRRAVMRRRSGPKIAQLAAVLGLDPPPLPVAWIAAEDRARAAVMLPESRIAGRPVLALGPTANWLPKVWPAERFAGLARALAAGPLPGAVPVVLGGPGDFEAAMAAPLLALLPEAIDLTGRLSLPEAAACLERAALFVGNDSGLMHLAAAAGTPTLGLFGPTPAAEYAPSGRRAAAVLASGTAPGAAMEDLAEATVLAAAERLLTQGASAPAVLAPDPV